MTFLAVAVVKGGGKTNGTEQAGSDLPGTNVVEQIEGDGTTNDVSQLCATRLGAFGLGGMRPFGSVVQPWNVVTEADVLNGWVVEHEIDSCTIVPPPGGAVTNLDWWARGAHDDDFRIPVAGWMTCLPFGALDGMTVLSRGEFRPRLLTPYYPRPFPEADLSLIPLAKWNECSTESLFWHAISPSNSLILTWQNAAYGRNANCPTNFQAEFFPDGRFDYRYQDRTVSYVPVYPFDWDGDGLENAVDPAPHVAGPDAHGTNAEWYNIVCSNVFSAVEGPNGIELSPRTGEVNTNAYYFVDVVAERGPAVVRFVADGESRLGNPVVVAQVGETNHVPLLIGATYSVTSDVPFTVVAPPSVSVTLASSSGTAQNIQWPVPIDFMAGNGGSITPHVPEELRLSLDGSFSWSGGCCVSITGDSLTYSCHACGCGGCSAIAAYRYENYSLSMPAVTCGCAHNGGDPSQTPFVTTPGGAVVAAGFDRKFVVLTDGGTNGPIHSTRTVLTLAAWGGTNGGTLKLEPVNFGRLRAVGGELPSPGLRTLLPYEAWSAVVTNEGVVASESLDDVRIRATFEENNTMTRIVRNARLTVCEFAVTGIKFNHDTGAYTNDAINIRLDGSTNGVYHIENGEWCGGGKTNCPACYVGGTSPVVEVRFQAKPHDLSQACFGARASAGDFPLGDVMTNDVRFVDGDSGWVRFKSCDGTNVVPMQVDVVTSKWNWHVDHVQAESLNEPFDFSTTGPHKVYTVLDHPMPPWEKVRSNRQCAWSYALEFACSKAKHTGSSHEVMSSITSNLFYKMNFAYDTTNGAASYFKGTLFEAAKYIMQSNLFVNCYDQSYAVETFANLLGANSRVVYREWFGFINTTNLIGVGLCNNPFYNSPYNLGSNTWRRITTNGIPQFHKIPLSCAPICSCDTVARTSFGNHMYVLHGGLIFDACAGPILGTYNHNEYLSAVMDCSTDDELWMSFFSVASPGVLGYEPQKFMLR